MFRVEDRHWWYLGLRGMIDRVRRCHIAPGDLRVLDAGCGTGANLVATGQWARVVGVDLSPRAVAFCRKRDLDGTAVGSVTHLPFASGSFDIVLSMDVIQHQAVSNKEIPIREMARVLRPGGLLLINVPAYQCLHSSHDVAVHQDRRFTRPELLAMLRRNGLAPIEATYWNTALFPIAALVRLWRKKHPPSGSDLLDMPGPLASAVLTAILAIERRVIRLFPLPFGLSVFVVARRVPA